MKYADIVIVKRWIPILEEYERTKAKIAPRPFKFVKTYAKHIISQRKNCLVTIINGLRGERHWNRCCRRSEVPNQEVEELPNPSKETSSRPIDVSDQIDMNLC